MKSKPPLIRKTWPKIRLIMVRGESFYQVDGRRKGTNGRQESFSTKGDAEKRAAELAADFASEGATGILSPELRVFALKADALLQPYGKSVLEAAEFFKGHLDSLLTKQNSRLIGELAGEWYLDKKAGTTRSLRDSSLTDISHTSQLLAKIFPHKRILEVGTGTIEKALADMRPPHDTSLTDVRR